VQEDASGKLELAFVDLGEQQLKNIARPVRVYTIRVDTESAKAAGMHDRAIEHVETAMRLSPRERFGSPLVVLGLAHFFKRQFDDAAAKLRLAMQENPGSPAIYRALAACYAQMGQVDEARHTVERLRALTSVVVPADLPWRKPQDRDLFVAGLRLAMGETK
jgi:tetratricopeptide (TPR) repeat protein